VEQAVRQLPLTQAAAIPWRMAYPDFVLSLSCPDRRGIVAEVTRFLFERNCNILDSQQFGDRDNGRFFMRVHGQSEGGTEISQLGRDFAPIAGNFAMQVQFFDNSRKTRAVIMVSKFGHALVDLLYRVRIGAIRMDVPLIVSNHCDFQDVAAAQNIPFVHLPVTGQNKMEQEARLTALLDEHRIDLVVLARYMQILSDDFCKPRRGGIINIHHSFLPSFKGANPYTQAHERGGQTDWSHRALRYRRPGRRPDHRSIGGACHPCLGRKRLCLGGPRYRKPHPGARRPNGIANTASCSTARRR
jgi:formyltetrahydrofolate deformylase